MRIKELIKEKGYTHKALAEKLGISVVGLSQIVNGKPSYTTMEKIAAALDAEVWELFIAAADTDVCPKCGERIHVKQ